MGDTAPCCPACHKPYVPGDDGCDCGAVLERTTGEPLNDDGLPALVPHGPPPRDERIFWLEVEGTTEVRFRGQKTLQIRLEPGAIAIGRRDPPSGHYPDIDLQGVPDFGFTARRHARLTVERGSLFLTDVKGEGTTAINEIGNSIPRDSPTPLRHGDRIIIGEAVTMRVVVHETE